MRKRFAGKKLSRSSGARRALFRALIRAQVLHGKIVTTKTKAKLVQKQLDKIINLTKKGGLAKRRQVYAKLGNDREVTDLLFQKVAPNFKDRVGGYTRIINLPKRRGDAAEIARIEWVKDLGLGGKKEKGKKKETKTKKQDKKGKKDKTK